MRVLVITVVDNSIVMCWYFKDEANEYAEAVARSISQRVIAVPSTWPLEVANTLIVGERRGRSTREQAEAFFSHLRAVPFIVDFVDSEPTWQAVIPMARELGLSAHDAAYLELALRLNAVFSSLEAPLLAAAKVVGVKRMDPAG